MVCINKHDLNEENTRKIEDYCTSHGLPPPAKVPFDNVVTEAIVKGMPVVEYSQGVVTQQVKGLWKRISTNN